MKQRSGIGGDENATTHLLHSKAIAGCLEVQNYAMPLISPTYQEGVMFEQKLSSLLHFVHEKPGCEELKTELERVDDLMFQLKYMCMAPMLSTIEKIEAHLNRYVARRDEENQQDQGNNVDSFDGRIVEFAKKIVETDSTQSRNESDHIFEPEDVSVSSENEATFVVAFEEKKHGGYALRKSSHHSDDVNKYHGSAEGSGQFDTILEEPTDRKSDLDNSKKDQPPATPDSLTEALTVSQGTIDGLLDAFDGSGDTLDLSEAAFTRHDKDIIKSQRTFVTESVAAERPLDDSSGDVSVSMIPSSQGDGSISDGISTTDSTGRDDEERHTAHVQDQQKKFFDRLHHLFEVREKVEQRMKKIDPSGKLKEIEITIHSGGIQLEDGTFKAEYQQRDVKGKVAKTLADVYAAAEQANSSFLDLVWGVVDKVKGLDRFDAKIAPLKPRDRASEKAKSDYAHRHPGPPETWLYDILRATITCSSVKQLESLNKHLCKKAHIVQAKNRFATPAFNGYCDLLYHVRIPYSFRKNVYFTAEIQVLHKEMTSVEKLLGLKAHHTFFLSYFSGPEQSPVKRLEGLVKFKKAGAVDRNFVKSLLESKDAPQLSMLAGLFHDKLECYDEALQLYSHILDLEVKAVGENHRRTALVYQDMGLVLGKSGLFQAATQKLEMALSIQESVLGSEHPEVATTRSHLGHVLCLGGMHLQDALEHHRMCLSIRENCLGADHVDVATSYQNIGLTLGRLGDLEGSLVAYRRALSLLQEALGHEHAGVASTHSMIGTVLRTQGKFDEARREYDESLKIRTNILGKNHLATADSNIEMANMECELGEYDSAESRYREALRIRRNSLGVDHPDCAAALSNIGYVLSQKGNFEGAIREHRRALGIRDAILGKRHPDSLSSRQTIKAAMLQEKEI